MLPPSGTDLKESPDAATTLVSEVAGLLFSNGQTTKKLEQALAALAKKLGMHARVFPGWGELVLRFGDGVQTSEIVAVRPANVDMNKVAATMQLIDLVCDGRLSVAGANSTLATIAKWPPVSTARFALMAAAGAAALGVLFGATHLASLSLIALSAGAGGVLRRWLADRSRNLFIQPFCAALLAGVVGAVAVRWELGSTLRLIAVCPCMVLVPGPHLLNGALDLARGYLPLGLTRLAYAGLTVLMICSGLIVGLALLGVSLPAAGTTQAVPFGYDLIAAGVAVAAYGTFFSLPWRTLPVPILVGILAHSCRWLVSTRGGASAATGTLLACLIAGLVITPAANRLRLPFAGLGFATVVSMLPGVFLFRLASGLVTLVQLGAQAPADVVVQTAADGATALLLILAMVFGLFIPKFWIEHVWHG